MPAQPVRVSRRDPLRRFQIPPAPPIRCGHRRCLPWASFSKHRRRSLRRPDGVCVGTDSQSGSFLMTAARMSVTVAPSKVFLPDRASYKQHPNAQISLRVSTALPRACSGLMYDAVPMIAPSAVPLVTVGDSDVSADPPSSEANAFANPKSRILTLPSAPIMMLAGLRSRWTMPLSCAASSPAAIWTKSETASSTGIGPFAMRSSRVSPSTSSSTRKCVLPDRSRP